MSKKHKVEIENFGKTPAPAPATDAPASDGGDDGKTNDAAATAGVDALVSGACVGGVCSPNDICV